MSPACIGCMYMHARGQISMTNDGAWWWDNWTVLSEGRWSVVGCGGLSPPAV